MDIIHNNMQYNYTNTLWRILVKTPEPLSLSNISHLTNQESGVRKEGRVNIRKSIIKQTRFKSARNIEEQDTRKMSCGNVFLFLFFSPHDYVIIDMWYIYLSSGVTLHTVFCLLVIFLPLFMLSLFLFPQPWSLSKCVHIHLSIKDFRLWWIYLYNLNLGS